MYTELRLLGSLVNSLVTSERASEKPAVHVAPLQSATFYAIKVIGIKMPMKALILVGGFGTRLRPLTFTVPKPMVPFVNTPIIEHQIKALADIGVTEVVFAVSKKADSIADDIPSMENKYNIKIHVSVEDKPFGTAGPLALARHYLDDGSNDPFFVFNSDVTCDYPLKALLDFHKSHGKEGTILVTKVTDPSKYGVVVHDSTGKIERFVEKPSVFVGDEINAGMYCFNPSMLRRIKPVPTSIEKEIFPEMASANELYCMALPGYWMDIGQPKDFIIGTGLHLGAIKSKHPERLAKGDQFVGNVLVDATATIGEGSVLGPDVVIGPNVRIGKGVRIMNTTILASAEIEDSAFVRNSIIGWESRIKKWSRVDSSIFGADVEVSTSVCVKDCTVCPHKSIAGDIYNGALIM